ncbi:MAG: hypothetical protein VKL60_15035 [Sphaerospermopsis sp.]|nr:hypothetical protein [Sphaerospermopsis sp.]
MHKKQVIKLDLKTKQVLATYESIKEAAKENGFNYERLLTILKPSYPCIRKTNGFLWELKDANN